MAKKKQILYPVFFMILVTVVFTSGLAVLNELTIDRIEFQEALKVKSSILYAAGIEAPDDQINAVYDASIRPVPDGPGYIATVDGQVQSYILPFEGPGLWGTITGFMALTPDLDTLVGIDFLTHNETPGLGGRISETWFKEQFRGVTLEDGAREYLIYTPAPEGNVDAISGATGTSESVRKIFNETLDEWLPLAKEVF